MSSRYELAVVVTLNRCGSPTWTLICVAKPWIVELPEPVTSQALLGLPALGFSQATGLITGAQGAAANGGRPPAGTVIPTARRATARARRHQVVVRMGIGGAPPVPGLTSGPCSGRGGAADYEWSGSA